MDLIPSIKLCELKPVKKICFLLVLLFGCQPEKIDPWIMTTPAGDMYVEINKEGKTVLPNGRFITPSGLTHDVAPHPYGLELSPDGKIAVTSNSGTNLTK